MTVVEDTLKNNKKLCECDCGEWISVINKRGELARFKSGHNNKGERNPRWNNGRKKDGNYWMLLMPDYFSSDKKGYVYEHIYFYEQYHKCCMLPWGEVHHIEPVTKNYCNNMVWNLEGMTHRQHMVIHNMGNQYAKKDMTNRFCLLCGSKTTYTEKKTGYSHWREYKDGYLCRRCYARKKRNMFKPSGLVQYSNVVITPHPNLFNAITKKFLRTY